MSVFKQGDRERDPPKQEKKKDFFDEVGEEFDKLGNKFAKMFTSKNKQWEKKGEGHSLGTAADAQAAAERRRMAPDAAPNQAAAAAAARAQPPQQQARRPQSAAAAGAAEAAAARATAMSAPRRPTPAQASGAAAGLQPKFSCGGAVGGGGGGGSAVSDAHVALLQEMGFDAAAAKRALQASGGEVEAAIEMLASGRAPPAAQPQQSAQQSGTGGECGEGGMSAAEAVRVIEATQVPHGAEGRLRAMEAALETLVLAGGSAAVPLLLKLMSNIAAQPEEPKFRKVRLSNPKIAAAFCDVSPAALALLALSGFRSKADDESVCMGDAAAAEAPFLAAAVAQLQSWAELPAGALPAPPLGPSDFCVINEIAGDSSSLGGLAHNLPGDFYELSPAEVKAVAQAAAARRAQDETLRTKATRDAIAAKKKRRYRKALVRVRFPDGVLIQATFSVQAPVSLLLQWVSECLREPAHAFELSLPRCKPLTELEASLEEAELAPAALLNFRLSDAEHFHPPYLTAEVLGQGQTLSDATQAYPQGFGAADAQQLALARGAELLAGGRSPQRNDEPRPPPRWAPQ